MNGEQIFGFFVGVSLLTLVICVGAHNHKEATLIGEAIAAGVDPLEARCAYDNAIFCEKLTTKSK